MAHTVCAWRCISDTLEEGWFLDEKEKGEKRQGKSYKMNARRAKSQRGDDWKWKDDPVSGWLPQSSTTGWWSSPASLGKMWTKTQNLTALLYSHSVRLRKARTSPWSSQMYVLFHFCTSINKNLNVCWWIILNISTRTEMLKANWRVVGLWHLSAFSGILKTKRWTKQPKIYQRIKLWWTSSLVAALIVTKARKWYRRLPSKGQHHPTCSLCISSSNSLPVCEMNAQALAKKNKLLHL